MNGPDVILKCEALSLAYGRRLVLSNVEFEVRTGEFWFMLGPNGAGKTTLLRTILGMLRPQAGRLWLNPQLAARQRIGFVPQRCEFNHALPTTVREFVLLGCVGTRIGAAEQKEQLERALHRVGLGGMDGRDYWSLSGGQRQRALVARALVRRPSLLVLDEPTNGLDPAAEDSLLRLLGSLNQEDRLPLILVTHDIALAAHYATHAALFHGGGVIAGPAREVLQEEALREVYGVPVDLPQLSRPRSSILNPESLP